MDAINFIKSQHKKIKKTLSAISKKSRKHASKVKMFDNLTKFLVMHEGMEQKKWYPHFKNNVKVKKEVKHVISEEKKAGKALKKFKKVKTEAAWDKGFLKLKKAILHHAKCEETNLFPKVRRVLSKQELLKIGKVLSKYSKAQLKKK